MGNMSGVNNPHDKLFAKSLGNSEAMKEFIKIQFPEKIKKRLKLNSLSRESDSYIDERLSEFFTDLVFKIDLANDREGFVVCLLEHKSIVEKETVLQIFKYLARIWDEVFTGSDLPVIIPILFYHGEEKWTAPKKLTGLMKGNLDWAEKIIPNFEYILFTFEDVNNVFPKITVPRFKLYIRTLQVTRSKNRKEFFKRLSNLLPELNRFCVNQGMRGYFELSFRYILEVADMDLANKEEILDESKKITPERGEEIMTVAEELRQEGRQEGKEEGREEGRQEGREEELVETLKTLLEKKFNRVLPQDIKQKLNTVSRKRLVKIRDNFFEIDSLKDVKKLLND